MPAGVRLLYLLLYSECGKIEKQIAEQKGFGSVISVFKGEPYG